MMTVNELIADLKQMAFEYDAGEAEVRIAYQPTYPLMVGVGRAIVADGVVYIAEGGVDGYLPEDAVDQLNWGMSNGR